MQLSTETIQVGFIIMSAIAGLMLIFLRIRAGKQPTTLRKIIIPPVGMSTGFMMFLAPMTHIPWGWGLAAFGTGLLIFLFRWSYRPGWSGLMPIFMSGVPKLLFSSC